MGLNGHTPGLSLKAAIKKAMKRCKPSRYKKRRDQARRTSFLETFDNAALHTFVSQFRDNIAKVPLVRIGGDCDGGYLLPDDFEDIRYCFSPGVSTTADFEECIAKRFGIRSFMADASIERLPVENPLFEFDKTFLGAHCDETFTTLDAWVSDKLDRTDDNDLILQMDIEGGEFGVLIESDSSLLRRFRIMVIEFHSMERIFERHSLSLLCALFAKIHQEFVIVHLHANNCCGIATENEMSVPRVFEITYLRHDRVKNLTLNAPIHLPHALDKPNVPTKQDITMPEIWWKNQ